MGKSMWLVGSLIVALALFAPVTHAQTSARAMPSFACVAGQGVIERTICASPDLAAADRTMAALYAEARVSAFGTGPSNELASQREALKAMHLCATPPGRSTVAGCLQTEYAARNEALAIAVLLRAPDLALPVLRKTDPAFAPLLEALLIWAAEPRDTNWAAPALADKRTRILALLRPYMTELRTKPDESFGRDLLADPSGTGIGIDRIEQVLLSDRNFAAFYHVLGPYVDDSNWPDRSGAARTLPCMAIVRHPALLAATGAEFGSTLDNFVFDNDCDATLPPLPALAELAKKLNAKWPDCEGTIRFMAYRVFQTSVDEARLGLAKHNPRAASLRRNGVTASDIDAARIELAGYYAKFLVRSPHQAKLSAEDAITGVLATSQQCE